MRGGMPLARDSSRAKLTPEQLAAKAHASSSTRNDLTARLYSHHSKPVRSFAARPGRTADAKAATDLPAAPGKLGSPAAVATPELASPSSKNLADAGATAASLAASADVAASTAPSPAVMRGVGQRRQAAAITPVYSTKINAEIFARQSHLLDDHEVVYRTVHDDFSESGSEAGDLAKLSALGNAGGEGPRCSKHSDTAAAGGASAAAGGASAAATAVAAPASADDDDTRPGDEDVVDPVSGARIPAVMQASVNDPTSPFWFIHRVRIGKTEDSEFVYMTAAAKSDISYNPYNLRLVGHRDINKSDFYTMSVSGVTHFVNGAAEFTSLEQWEREFLLYHRIMRISLFRRYRLWKAYMVWRKNVRSSKMVSCKEVLENNLFILNPILRSSVLSVRDHCHKIALMRLYKLKDETTYTLDEFKSAQEDQRTVITMRLNQALESLREAVWVACETALDNAGFTKDSNMANVFNAAPSSPTATAIVQPLDPTTERSASSMARNKAAAAPDAGGSAPPKMSYTELAAKRTECRRLTGYIKLCDYLLTETLHNLALSSIHDIVRYLTPKTEPVNEAGDAGDDDTATEQADSGVKDPDATATATAGAGAEDSAEDATAAAAAATAAADAEAAAVQTPVFRIERVMDHAETALVFEPNGRQLQESMDAVIGDFVNVVVSVEKMITHADFTQFTRPTFNDRTESNDWGEGPDLGSIILEDDQYQSLISTIKTLLDQAFAKSESYASCFEPFFKLYRENLDMTMDKLEEDGDLGLEYFGNSLDKYTEQRESIEAMETAAAIGIIWVDSTRLKQQLLPSPIRCLQCLHAYLPTLSRTYNEELLSELNTGIKRLSTTPSKVEAFVEYLSFLQDVNDRYETLQARFKTVKSMYAMMERYKIKIPDEEYALYQTLAPTFSTLKATTAFSEASKDDNINAFSAEVEKDIERLGSLIMDLKQRGQHPMISDPDCEIDDVLAYVDELEGTMRELKDLADTYTHYQATFRVPVAKYPELDETVTEIGQIRLLWQSLQQWGALTSEWNTAPFEGIDVEVISQEMQKYQKYIFQLDRGLPKNPVVGKLRDLVEEFKLTLPVVLDLRNPALKPRHWDRIQNVIQQPLTRDQSFTLGMLLDLKVMDFKEEISTIAMEATNEGSLEEMLKKIEAVWNVTEFTVVPHKESKDMSIIQGVDDVIAQLEDSQVTVATIRGSRFLAPIKHMVDEWDHNLQLFAETIDEWLVVQRNWLYLESIFSAADIQRQLPNETKLFMGVDKNWKDLMRKTRDNPNALRAATGHGVLEMLQTSNGILEKIQKSLEDYLETKRLAFPRFYFLSNDELLEILAQSKNHHAVQPHLRKCFDNLFALEFSSDPKNIDIYAMISGEGERVSLGKNLKARGAVESWLAGVEQAMFTNLRRLTKLAVVEYEKRERHEWVLEHAAQIVLIVNQIYWARDVIDALNSANPRVALQAVREKCVAQLNELARLVCTDLTKLQRGCLTAVITIDVHARDIVQNLIDEGVDSVDSFGWAKQLRYKWDSEVDDVLIRQNNASFNYGFEYLGCSPRLIITPLTDRCYMTLTGALHMCLGGAPAGPAGTGKTETVKDLAKALAIQCVVFNCSDSLDYKIMGQLFAGLAQSGAWMCFDEFNRIDIEVLSVVAQQLLTIRGALASKAVKFVFEGREIRLNPTCGFFITMNPGYAGRTELPDNLAACFRPVAMMVPDYGLIAEIMLFCEGFTGARELACKMVSLYQLSSEQLSQQDHYDFGMRAVKSVLVMAGALKRSHPDLPEDVVLIRSLRDSNIPKFLSQDVPLFYGIMSDLFPGVEVPDQDYGALKEVVEQVLVDDGLQVVDEQVLKIIQLYETMVVRHGVMLVGPTGGGKTIAYHVLANALTKLCDSGNTSSPYFQKVRKYILNPKCITMGELYGEFNLATHEWSDGLVASMVREIVVDETQDHKWVVFDGPVDALWIENMNTVLDDNKLLCLANSERIKLNNTIHMVFEVQDLAVASPATVSRCGMVYIGANALGWSPCVQSWLAKLPEEIPAAYHARILALFDKYVEPGLTFLRTECKESVPSTDQGVVASLCNLLQGMLLHKDAKWDREPDVVDVMVDSAFVFSYVWTIGGNITPDSQDGFDVFAREQFESIASIPGAKPIYEYYVNLNDARGDVSFAAWDGMVPEFKYDANTPYFNMLVPTVDTVRFAFLLEQMLGQRKSVLFTGQTGVGKSVIINSLLTRITSGEGAEYVQIPMNFSAQTDSARTQEIIESKLEKKRKTILGGPAGKQVVLFVDDINMPQPEIYGAQPPIELLRHYLCFGGFYDRTKLYWKDIKDVVLVAACAPPGGGRNALTPRLMRHFHMLSVPPPSETSLATIFSSILGGYLTTFDNKEILDLTRPTVKASIEVYHRIASELLPTPAKSHYTFNLRDLSKVFQGVLQLLPDSSVAPDTMVRLWCHESMRVFHDRLVCKEDRDYFTQLLVEMVQRHFGLDWDHEATFVNRRIMFGNYMKMPSQMPADTERPYEELTEPKRVMRVLEDYLEQYNLTMPKEMKLVFFADAIDHVSRISRILRQQRGNALLVGVSGTGKQSLTRLAAFMAEYKCHQIELKRNYGPSDFREDLKRLYLTAGVAGEPIVFLLTDTQIVHEGFLEDINNILNSGEVPNLFEMDELEKVIGDLAPVVKDLGLPESRDVVLATFIQRVRQNLHIVLCMSPVGDAFRSRCRRFPSLVNCCTIDWFEEWPADALLSVSERFFAGVDLGSPEMSDSLARCCVSIHASVADMAEEYYQRLRRRYYTTPTSYLEFLNMYLFLLDEKRREIGNNIDRLRNGLAKLLDTNELVNEMQKELAEMQPVLQEKAVATERFVEELAKDQEKADAVRKVVMADEAQVKEQTAQVEVIAEDAQRDLDEALPALEDAIKALNALNKTDITEMKSFTKPPELVQTVMEAVCLLLGRKQDWPSALALMKDSSFLNMLLEYDKDSIPESSLRKLKKYIDNPNFQPANVAKVSTAAKSLCMWVRAMDTYAHVSKTVAPKRAKLEEANAMLSEAQGKLKEKQDQLAAVENQLAELRRRYENTLAEKVMYAERIAETEKRLQRASKLTSGLSEEQVRWSEQATELDTKMGDVVGNSFLAAACIAYHGAFTGEYREKLTRQWVDLSQARGIPVSSDFSLLATTSDPVQVRDWNIWGLPSDTVSLENGIFVTKGRRWPLMIDPQGQANRWIKNMEAKNGLKVIRLSDPNFLRTLENSIRIGTPVLLEDINETLDPALEPILLNQTFRQAGRLMIRLGDSDVDYDANFRFYMTTKLSNPHYMPEVCIRATIINFTVTTRGLEDQLLGDVVQKERPELEEQRDRLVISMAADKKQLKDIEDKILKLMSASEGNILDDEVLIHTLNDSKVTSGIISGRVKEAEETEKNINAAREAYRPVATRGSILYFVLADCSLIDPMYQYSLSYLSKLFSMCLETAEKSPDLDVRLTNLIDTITHVVYTNVSRGLFAKDKTILSFVICCQIMRNTGEISDLEWNLLLRGPIGMSDADMEPRPQRAWLTDATWKLVSALGANVEALAALPQDVKVTADAWYESMMSNDTPQLTPLPGDWNDCVSPFQRLLIIKAFRPEKLVFACTELVSQRMGRAFTQDVPFDLASGFKDTSPSTPFIFILSQGADPTSHVLRFAKEEGMSERLKMISLGQGQGPIAASLVAQAAKNGDWIMLQNCHLAVSWLPQLEKIVEGFSSSEVELHPDFRLWLSSMPSKAFPVTVLQNSIKMTNEPPKGVRANLLRNFTDLTDELWDSMSEHAGKQHAWRKLLFGLVFFSSVIQERKRFGPLGWNITYSFNESDLEVSRTTLQMYLEECEDVPWDALRYLTGDVHYGGRVTDDWDRRCLKSILNRFYTPEILADAYRFSPSGTYYAPAATTLAEVRQYVESLPETEDPEIFGMHENANISYQRQETNRMLSTILSIQPRIATASASKTPDDIVRELMAGFLDHLPPLMEKSEAQSALFEQTNGRLNSLTTVLMQEVDRFNRLIQVMRRTGGELLKAIKGLVVMSEALESMFDALLNNQVPKQWADAAYLSLKPLSSWMADFHRRVEFFRAWMKQGQPPCFWVSAFFFPQGFLTAVLQNYARRNNVPIDGLSFKFTVTTMTVDDVTEGPDTGVYIHGLYMDGARWHDGKVCDSLPGQMKCEMPVIWLQPTQGYVRNAEEYECPLYKVSTRAGVLSTTGRSTNFVLPIDLPCDEDAQHWVLKAVALLCQTDD